MRPEHRSLPRDRRPISRTTVATLEIDEAIRARRSVRQFRDEPVSPHDIDQAIETALWSPSPHNSQPWRFVTLGHDGKATLAEAMAAELRSDLARSSMDEQEISRMTTRSIARVNSAPAALLCCTVDEGLKLTGDVAGDILERQMAVQSVGAVLQSLFLALAARNIGACWMAAPMYCRETVRSVLNLPRQLEPQALVLIGYSEQPGRVRPRRPIDEVVIRR